jgi:hypothetical protein
MDPNAHRSGERPPGADAYWQRRFFTLLAGLGVIGLLAWACSGLIGGGNSAHAAGSGQPSSASAAYSTPTAIPTSPSPVSSTPSASPTPAPSTSATPAASPSASASGRAAQVKPKAKPKTASGPVACPASDLVLTVTPTAASYGTKAKPAFQVDIVSTDTTPCTLDTGPAALRLEVLHGSSVAYNSTVCVNGAKRHVITLRRGVPVITSMSWDKHETVTGCLSTVAAATNRTYSAVIQGGGAQSPRSSFRLTGNPATPPAKAPATRKTSTSR